MRVREMALYPLLYVDGGFGDTTQEYFQRYMKDNGWYYGLIDADFGAMSWQGVQRMCRYHGRYNRAIDGDPGYYTWKALDLVLYGDFPWYDHCLNPINYGIYPQNWTGCTVGALQNGLNILERYNKGYLPRVYHV